MKTTHEVYAEIIAVHQELNAIPPDLHLFCPKVSDDDDEDYDDLEAKSTNIGAQEKKARIENAQHRLALAAWASLILGIQEDEADKWLVEWKTRTESFLTKCDVCVRAWQKNKKALHNRFLKEFDEETTNIMEGRLHDFDKARIDRGLQSATKIIGQRGPLSTSKLATVDETAVLALFEALCCIPYLSTPDNRRLFNFVFQKVQEKKPLRMGKEVLPTMVVFLFQEDPFRNTFARTAWQSLPAQSLTSEQFEWAVNEHLAAEIEEMKKPEASLDQIKLFWEGFLILLDAMSEDLIIHSLRGMQIQPDVYALAIQHLACNSEEILALLIQALSTLMKRSSKAFWDALSNLPAHQLTQHVSTSPAFGRLVSRSFEASMMITDGTGSTTPLWVAFVRSLMQSLAANRRHDVCDTLLSRLLDDLKKQTILSREGQATCTLAGLTALQLTLDGFLDPKYRISPGDLIVNLAINNAANYREVIANAARLQTGDRYNIGLSTAAVLVIQSALALDTKAINEEWRVLQGEKSKFSSVLNRQSFELWLGFLEVLQPGRTDVARAMLRAVLPLGGVQKCFLGKRGDSLSDSQERFNNEFEKTAEIVARTIERVSEFGKADYTSLCSDAQPPTIDAIVSTLIHGDDAIRDAGVLFINTMTGAVQRSDAIASMLQNLPESLLLSFCEAVDNVTLGTLTKSSLDPWPPMIHIQTCSRDILNGLCDTTTGLLRSRTLSSTERKAVKRWWIREWQFVDYSFQKARSWSHLVEKRIMEDYCRDVMEFAESLLAQDGLIASALGHQRSHSPSTTDESARIMKEVLDAPQKYSRGFIEMIQLKDTYLLSLMVRILVKLFRRLNEYEMALPEKVLGLIRNACTPNPAYPGKYIMNTNLSGTQRAELLDSLGDEPESEVEFLTSVPVGKEKDQSLKQSNLEAWSRSGPSIPIGVPKSSVVDRSNKDVVTELTPHTSKLRGMMDRQKKPTPKVDQKAILARQQAIKETRARDKAEFEKHKAEAKARAARLRAGGITVTGEGSSLQGLIGVVDKDHAPKKSDIMVDSASEDDDESGDDDAALVRQSKKGDKVLDEAERRRRATLQQLTRGPIKKVKLQRSAKDMRARLIPPMDKLHLAILEWDIFHEGNDPPNGYKCEAVANAYPSPKQYKDTFFPLLVYEAWRSFVTAKDECTSKPFGIKILNRMNIDYFLEISTSMPIAANKDRHLAEGDIILLSRAENPLNDPKELHCLARIWKTTFKKDVLEVAYRISLKGNQILPVLLPGGDFQAVKITNMTTIEREYAALESLQYYDLMDEVLNATPSPILKFGDQVLGDYQRNYELNRGQAVAILNAKENDGFTLVQGPPGTGKTKTIVAMVGALLTGTIKNNASAVAIGRPGLQGGSNNGSGVAKKLLVCAPSNAAVDELVLRLKSGIRETNGTTCKINVLRLGRSDAINAAVKDVTLDELVKAEIERETGKTGDGKSEISDREKMHQRAGEIKMQMTELIPALEAARCGNDRDLVNKLQREHDNLRTEQRKIGGRIEQDKQSGNTYAREAEIKRRQVQQRILNEAHVLCATLSGSGHEMFKNLNVEFETVIIDEAAQCVELSALIPLKYGCSKCVLVGDPKQLPPTVLSQSAARYGYDQSLFVRMQQNHPKDVHLLDTQYRMHPEISLFPSQQFYERLLVDGGDMARLRRQPWHENPLLGPYRFFDVEGIQERGNRGQSLVNVNEVQVAMQLYRRFRSDYNSLDITGKIGIITPYKAQLFALRRRFSEQYGEDITQEIEFNTTDAFQGRECEIIIFSCVRASPTGGIGFMTDIRRMNVGLTRAKSSLWILGDARALRQGEFWNELIKDAKVRDRYTAGNILGLLKTSSSKTRNTPLPAPSPDWQGGLLPPAAPTPITQQRSIDEDVEMIDDRNAQQLPSRQLKPPPTLPTTYAVVGRQAVAENRALYASPVAGLDERGQVMPLARGIERPTVHSSPASESSGLSKKRLLESGAGSSPPPKRISNGHPPQPPVPLGPKAMKPPRRPTDPSAMEVLGTDKKRGDVNGPPKTGGPAPGVVQAPKKPMLPPRKKAPADPFIRKKGKR